MGAYDVTADVTGSVVSIELLVDYCRGVVDPQRVSPPTIRRIGLEAMTDWKVEGLSGAVDNEASRLRLQYSCIIFSDLPGIHISRPACACAHAKGTM